MILSDPRQYTHDYPKSNLVINQALEVLANRLSQEELYKSMANFLAKENDALINVAISLSPSSHVSKIIWESLNTVINQSDSDSFANLFTIPIVLVAGSKNVAKLTNHIDDTQLNEFFYKNGLFNNDCDCFISGKLIDSKKISGIRPSQLYHWVRSLKKAKLWLPIEIEGSTVEVFNEGVFLRFLVGVSIGNNNNTGLNTPLIQSHLIDIMQLINSQLKTSGVTLFSIPFMPIQLSKSIAIGNYYRTEIAISVALSNIIRKIREKGLNPQISVSTNKDAIEIKATTHEPSNLIETSLWNLTRFDEFEQVLQSITNLLNDFGVKWEYVTNTN